jgi:hypothetical protein
MKIAISGTSDGFGNYASLKWGENHEIIKIDLREEISVILSQIEPCDIFLNHAYSKDVKQSLLFFDLFEKWKDLEKTIINFGTSAVQEDGIFSPLYVSNKKHLINLSQTLNISNPHKKVRVINFNPSTMENNKLFGSEYTKLKFEDLFKIINFIIELDYGIEISDITIKSTTRQEKNKTII